MLYTKEDLGNLADLREKQSHADPSLQEKLKPIVDELEASAEKGDFSQLMKINAVLGEISAAVKLILNKEGKEVLPEGFIGNLEKDYKRAIDTLEYYKLIKNGAYTGDYAEFKGVKFPVPKLKEILGSLSAREVKLYKEMEAREEEPQLQLTPLALKLSTMGEKIDAKKKKLKINSADTYTWCGIKEKQLIYKPETYATTDNGKNLILSGGKSKAELIKENNGWLVSIVSTRPELNVDADKVEKEVEIDGHKQKIHLTTAEKIVLYMTEARSQGYEGLTHEAYMIAQMEALRKARLLDTKTYAMLPESCLVDQERAAFGDWNEDRLRLYGRVGALQVYGVRFRRSVRVGVNS